MSFFDKISKAVESVTPTIKEYTGKVADMVQRNVNKVGVPSGKPDTSPGLVPPPMTQPQETGYQQPNPQQAGYQQPVAQPIGYQQSALQQPGSSASIPPLQSYQEQQYQSPPHSPQQVSLQSPYSPPSQQALQQLPASSIQQDSNQVPYRQEAVTKNPIPQSSMYPRSRVPPPPPPPSRRYSQRSPAVSGITDHTQQVQSGQETPQPCSSTPLPPPQKKSSLVPPPPPPPLSPLSVEPQSPEDHQVAEQVQSPPVQSCSVQSPPPIPPKPMDTSSLLQEDHSADQSKLSVPYGSGRITDGEMRRSLLELIEKKLLWRKKAAEEMTISDVSSSGHYDHRCNQQNAICYDWRLIWRNDVS